MKSQLLFLLVFMLSMTHARAQFEEINKLWYNGTFPDSILAYTIGSNSKLELDIKQYFITNDHQLIVDSSVIWSEFSQKFNFFYKTEYTYDHLGRLSTSTSYSGINDIWLPDVLDSIFYNDISGEKESSISFAYNFVNKTWEAYHYNYYDQSTLGKDSFSITLNSNQDTVFSNIFINTDSYYLLKSYEYDNGNWLPIDLDSFAVYPDMHIYTFSYYEDGEFIPEFLDTILLNANKQWYRGHQYYTDENGNTEFVYYKEFYYPDSVMFISNNAAPILPCNISSLYSNQLEIIGHPELTDIVQISTLHGQVVLQNTIVPGQSLNVTLNSGFYILNVIRDNKPFCVSKIVIN